MTRIALLLALALSLSVPASAFYKMVSTEETNFSRSPFGTQQTLDSDIRLRGMGFVSLPIQDESNTIGVFKYGGFAAGLPLDYSAGKAEFQYFMEGGEIESGMVDSDLDKQGLGLMAVNPFSFGTLAFQKQWEWDELDQPGSTTQEFGVRDFTLGYGRQFGSWIGGLNVEHTLDRNTTGATDNRLYKTEVSPSIGYQFQLGDTDKLTAVFGPRFINWEQDGTGSEYDIDGEKYGAGVLWERGAALRIAGFYDTGSLEGEDAAAGVRTGDRELERSALKLRGYYRPEGCPLSFGGLYEQSVRTTEITDLGGMVTSDVERDRKTLGGGVAYNWDRGLLGLEYQRILADDTTEDINPTSSDTNEVTGNQISFGGEYRLGDLWTARGGIMTQTLTAEPFGGAPDADLELMQYSLGADYRASDSLTFAIALWLASREQDAVPSIGQNDDEFAGSGFQFLTKFHF